MIEHVPYLSTEKVHEPSLNAALNEMSSFSRLVNLLVSQTNNQTRLIDFTLLLHLIFESAYDKQNRLEHTSQLINRFHHRYHRVLQPGFADEVVRHLHQANWITHDEGLKMNEAGIRMSAFIFDFLQQNYAFQLKDGLERAKFLAELSGIKLELFRKIGLDNEAVFLNQLNAIQFLTEEIKKNMPLYVQRRNAIKEITELKNLLEKCTNQIKQYVDDATIINRIDEFRIRYAYVEAIMQEALLVAQDGLGEILKAISLSSSEVWTAGILPDEFVNNLTRAIQEEIRREDRKRFQSAEDLVLQMDVASGEVLTYLPAKILGGLSAENILNTIDAAEEGQIDLGLDEVMKKGIPDFSSLDEAEAPQTMSMAEIAALEKLDLSKMNDSEYMDRYREVLGYALAHGGDEKTLISWINAIGNGERFDGVVFLDLLAFLVRDGYIQIDPARKEEVKLTVNTWSFVTNPDYPALLSGKELARMPSEPELTQDNYLDRLIGFARSEIHERRNSSPT